MTWRVGLLVPSSNSVMEVDFYRSLPRDARLHTSRLYTTGVTGASEEHALDQFVMPAAQAVGIIRPHVVVFGCTGARLLRGNDYDRDLCVRLSRVTGAVTLSISAAVDHAQHETRATRIAVITPYVDAMNERIKASVEAGGIEVSAMHGMGLTGHDIASVTPEAIYAFVQSRIGPRVPGEALFLAGTDYRAMDTLSLLKITYDVPLATNNLAALQAVKRIIESLREREMALGDARGLAST